MSKTIFPTNIDELDVVSSEGNMPPHVFNTENIVTEVYLRVMTNIVKPWMEIVVWKAV